MGQLFDLPEEPPAGREVRATEDLPLAARMRPRTLEEFVGQTHLLGPSSALRTAIQSGEPHSMILYGPPGTGKTTLARMLAEYADAAFEELSAVEAGRPEVREVIARARERRRNGRHTIFFLDEIHRFNKAQQDALLPAVEEGLVVLVGATTENPYFEVNSALISRTQVYELHELTAEDIAGLLRRALDTVGKSVSDEVIDFLAARSGGDARSSLNALELALDTADRTGEPVTLADAEDAMQRKALRYDKGGDQHYDYISAWIKSTRGSDPDASLYYLAAMLEGGEDPRFIVRRMVILASEDVGNADPQALVIATAAAAAVEHVGLPEATYALAQSRDLPRAGAEVQRRRPCAGRRAGPDPRVRRRRPAWRAALRGLPRRAQAGPRHRLRLPARPPGADQRPGTSARGPRAPALLRARRDGAGAARAAAGDPRGTRPRRKIKVPGTFILAPATGARLGTVPEVDVAAAAAAALAAQPLWSLVPVRARARYIGRAAVAMLDELDDLALRLVDETGWPHAQVMLTELLPAVRGLRALAETGPGALADRRLSPRTARLAGRRTRLLQAPVGVVGVRGPSASPWAEPALDAAAALLAGNGVVLAAGAPLAAHRLRSIFLRAGVPGELLAVGAAPADLEAHCRRVVDLRAPGRRGTLLVLNGSARERVVEAAMWAGFGRHAAAAGRLIVTRGAAPGLVEALSAAAARLRVGDPRDPAVDVGPAEIAGERVAVPGLDGSFVRPAVVTVEPDDPRFTDPPAGPLLAVVEVADSEAAITLAQRDGRAGPISIWARDEAQGERVARRLPSPVAWVGRHGLAVTGAAGAARAPRRAARARGPRRVGARHAAAARGRRFHPGARDARRGPSRP